MLMLNELKLLLFTDFLQIHFWFSEKEKGQLNATPDTHNFM